MISPSLWMNDLMGLFFPRVCQSCSVQLFDSEDILCMKCRYKLPQTNFHSSYDNPVMEIFKGRIDLYSATSFLFFNKGGMAQQTIHRLKYKGKKEIGLYLGKLFGRQLNDSELFNQADAIIPVPLHPKRQFKRGYNQSFMIATGMAVEMKAEVYSDVLFRTSHTSSQTKKTRYERWENVKDIFEVKHAESLIGKHLVLVDDVITTGATLEACANSLLQIPDIKLSIASLAYSQG